VKNFSTQFVGGASAIGFVTSTTVLPDRFEAPAARSASALAVPFTARTTISPVFAASAKEPTRPFGFFPVHSFSFAGSRVPIMTSWPCFRNPLASVFATSPDPSTPTFISVSFSS